MARRPRLDMAGYHHVLNRGVARLNIFTTNADKDKFLQILCKACKTYRIIVHDYCLMDNHYHLLLETEHENLSLMMRQVNSHYAIYFNKKEKRTGHLWQGRFRSWYILSDDYLYLMLRYIEHNPIKAGMTKRVGEYAYSFASTLFGNGDLISCAKKSILIQDFTSEELMDFLETELSDDELKTLEKEQKRKVAVEENHIKVERSKSLNEYFNGVTSKQERNQVIIEAFKDGHTQSSIAKYLNLSAPLICGVIKNED